MEILQGMGEVGDAGKANIELRAKILQTEMDTLGNGFAAFLKMAGPSPIPAGVIAGGVGYAISESGDGSSESKDFFDTITPDPEIDSLTDIVYKSHYSDPNYTEEYKEQVKERFNKEKE
jgi:hypothetical protein